MASRLAAALLVTLPLGGCLHAVSAARTTVADVVPNASAPRTGRPTTPTWKPACPGLEVDGECETTSLRNIHPSSNLAPKTQPSGEVKCPPTVLGVPGWCARF